MTKPNAFMTVSPMVKLQDIYQDPLKSPPWRHPPHGQASEFCPDTTWDLPQCAMRVSSRIHHPLRSEDFGVFFTSTAHSSVSALVSKSVREYKATDKLRENY